MKLLVSQKCLLLVFIIIGLFSNSQSQILFSNVMDKSKISDFETTKEYYKKHHYIYKYIKNEKQNVIYFKLSKKKKSKAVKKTSKYYGFDTIPLHGYNRLCLINNIIYYSIPDSLYYSAMDYNISWWDSINQPYLIDLQKKDSTYFIFNDKHVQVPLFYLYKKCKAYCYPYFFKYFAKNHNVELSHKYYNIAFNDTIFSYKMQYDTAKYIETMSVDEVFYNRIDISLKYGFLYVEFKYLGCLFEIWYKPYSIKNEVYNVEIE